MKMMLAFVAAVLTAVSCGSKKEAPQQKVLGLYYSQTADLSGKKIVPFCSFGSGGLDTSVRDLKEKLPGAEILPGYGVRKARLEAMPAEVDNFLKAGGQYWRGRLLSLRRC